MDILHLLLPAAAYACPSALIPLSLTCRELRRAYKLHEKSLHEICVWGISQGNEQFKVLVMALAQRTRTAWVKREGRHRWQKYARLWGTGGEYIWSNSEDPSSDPESGGDGSMGMDWRSTGGQDLDLEPETGSETGSDNESESEHQSNIQSFTSENARNGNEDKASDLGGIEDSLRTRNGSPEATGTWKDRPRIFTLPEEVMRNHFRILRFAHYLYSLHSIPLAQKLPNKWNAADPIIPNNLFKGPPFPAWLRACYMYAVLGIEAGSEDWEFYINQLGDRPLNINDIEDEFGNNGDTLLGVRLLREFITGAIVEDTVGILRPKGVVEPQKRLSQGSANLKYELMRHWVLIPNSLVWVMQTFRVDDFYASEGWSLPIGDLDTTLLTKKEIILRRKAFLDWWCTNSKSKTAQNWKQIGKAVKAWKFDEEICKSYGRWIARAQGRMIWEPRSGKNVFRWGDLRLVDNFRFDC